MLNRLPPISALRAFDVAARELSFTKAAEVLHVSQSAVSHQIRHVESLWGIPLFKRRNRQVTLTREAQALIPVIREFFERLDRTLNELSAEESKGPLRVSLLQSFAFKWLVPRLARIACNAGADRVCFSCVQPGAIRTHGIPAGTAGTAATPPVVPLRRRYLCQVA
jgi:predicted transcriptional regulator